MARRGTSEPTGQPDPTDDRVERADAGAGAKADPDDAPAGAAAPTEPAHAADGVSELSYEQARDELVRIVAQLEGGQVPLEESMALWRRGEALAARCTSWLDGAQREINERDAAPPQTS